MDAFASIFHASHTLRRSGDTVTRRVPVPLEPVGKADMGQVGQHLCGGKQESLFFCWVREGATGA